MIPDLYFDNLKDTCLMALIQVITKCNVLKQELVMDYLQQIGLKMKPIAFNHVNVISQNLMRILQNDQLLINKYAQIELSSRKRLPDTQTYQEIVNLSNKNLNKKNMKNKSIVKYENLIGEGGYGKVYFYNNPIDKQNYAVKQIEVVEDNDDNGESEILNEVRIMAKLDHKNIVKYYFSKMETIERPMLNIYMELCYCNLQEYIKHRNMTANEINHQFNYYISQEICGGLKYLNSNLLIHGDLTTQNIFITAKFEIKIGDFGLTRCLDLTNNFIEIDETTCNQLYAAPEVRAGYLYKSSDIYSFGIILFELFQKFKTEHQRRSQIQKIITGLYHFPSTPPYPLIAKMTVASPQKRPSIEIIDFHLYKYASLNLSIQ